VVLPLRVLHARTLDAEDRHALAVHTPDLDVAQLAATHEPEGPKVQILGLKHRRLPLPHICGLLEESWAMVGLVEVGSVSPLLSGRRRGVCQDSHPTSVRLSLSTKPFKKPLKAKTLSSPFFDVFAASRSQHKLYHIGPNGNTE